MTFLDYLKTASPFIGGRVTYVFKDETIIKSDDRLPTNSGSSAGDFTVPRYDAGGLAEGAHVIFRWAHPGDAFDFPGKGKACDVKVVTNAERQGVTDKLRARKKLMEDLGALIKDAGDVAAAIEEGEELLDDPASALATAVAVYGRARSLIPPYSPGGPVPTC